MRGVFHSYYFEFCTYIIFKNLGVWTLNQRLLFSISLHMSFKQESQKNCDVDIAA